MEKRNLGRVLRRPALFVMTLLAIELLDEFVFGARETAWPLIRSDLQLTYEQIGVLLTVPALIASLIEPALGILADVGKRRVLILGGGGLFILALALTAVSRDSFMLLLGFILLYPSSGAFVALSQSTLMDIDPERHEQNMARWTLAGSVGVLLGSLLMGALAAVGGSWRLSFAFLSLFALGILLLARRFSFSNQTHESESVTNFIEGLRGALQALRRRDVLRWLILLEFSNLLLDVLYGYLALYFVDVVHVGDAEAGLAVATWTGVGLLGDFVLIPLLEKVQGLSYIRISAVLELVLFPLFLIIPGFVPKLIILGLIGFLTAGWYTVLNAQLYSAMPGQSGTVLAIVNVSGLLASFIPFSIGVVADRLGLHIAMWLLILGPVVLTGGLMRWRRIGPISTVSDQLSAANSKEVGQMQ